ncbi:Hypothetical protein FKW44_020867 [Caligus rogercresseyi]|uniref:Uncharacterized protein n=1 Tax=Caligus rogercresseyi TaxID=217165 RepID=A0A7T8JVC9_CALRO|nr:Hypothetical protein FKW44_020867 [Caligus rogercresseyi]
MDPELSVLLWSSSTYKFVEAEESLVKEEFEEIFKAEPIDDFLPSDEVWTTISVAIFPQLLGVLTSRPLYIRLHDETVCFGT